MMIGCSAFTGVVPHESRYAAFGKAEVYGVAICLAVFFSSEEPRWARVGIDN